MRYYQQALEVCLETGSRWGKAYGLGGMGDVYRELEQHTEALKYYEEALTVFKELGSKAEQLAYLSAVAMAYLRFGNKKRALTCSKKAIQMITDGQTYVTPQDMLFNHFQILSAHGRDEEALKYLQKAYATVIHQAKQIKNSKARESFLKNVSINRETLEVWKVKQRQGRQNT